jgi:ABC-type branched-subunit amino acid transport system substrate-binding protein/tRNA A-37 threonylcarbamoyl transferase component Bud32
MSSTNPCPECFAENDLKSRFCNACGHSFKGEPTAPLGAHVTAPAHAAAAAIVADAHPPGGNGLLEPDSVLQNRYRITQLLGQGGMGAVYLASDARFAARTCVIKEMLDHFNDPEQRAQATESFHREADLLATFKHPGIPEVYDRFTEANRHYLVMEYINGIDLEQRLIDHGAPFAEKEVIAWSIQCCDVLSYLHHQNPPIIYRDMKPANVITTHWGKAYLVDFGIARFFNPVTRGTMIGTQGYAPPEQYRGQVDPRSDIYALGATMHYLLTCRDPQNEAPFSFPPVSTLNAAISPEMEMFILKALDPEPDNRFASADEMLGELMAIGGDETDVVRDCPHCGHRSTVTRQFCPNCKQYISKKAHVLKRQEGSGVFITDAAGLHQVKATGRTESLVAGNRSATATVLAMPTGRVEFNLRRVPPVLLGVGVLVAVGLVGVGAWWSLGMKADPILSEGQYILRSPGILKSEGVRAYARKEYTGAADALRRHLESEPGDAEARIYYQNALLQLAPVKSVNVVLAGAWSRAGRAAEDDCLRGAVLAQQRLNARGVKPLLRLTLLDDQDATERALSGAAVVTREPSVVGVVGHLGVETTRAALPVYALAGLPVFHPQVFGGAAEESMPGLLRMGPSDGHLAARLLEVVKPMAKPVLVVDAQGADTRTALAGEFVKLAEGAGLNVELVAGESAGEVAKLCQARRAGAVVLTGPLNEAVAVNEALQQRKLQTKVLGGADWSMELVGGTLPGAAEGLVCAVPKTYDERLKPARTFVTEFRAKFQAEPGYLSALSYDALTILGSALRDTEDASAGLREGVTTVKERGYTSLVGAITFDEWGVARRPVDLLQIQGGRFVPYAP